VNFRLVCPWPCNAPARILPKTATSEISATGRQALPASIHFLCEDSEVTKLYVGNLPFTATEDGVRALFTAHGTVEKVSLITDRDTGKPRGFGFVEMSNADASRAMQALNGQDFEGRTLKINEAQDRDRSAGGGGGNRGPRRY
jgi:RNA recognition motif-containing protein